MIKYACLNLQKGYAKFLGRIIHLAIFFTRNEREVRQRSAELKITRVE